MKIGMIVESLQRPLEEGIPRARELGAEGIQIYAVSNYLDMLNDPPEKLKAIRDLADRNGLVFSAVCSGVSCFGAGATLTGGLAAGFGGSLTVRSTLRASSSVLASALSCSYALWSPLSMAIVSLMMRRDAAM